jgi:FkbM family methyltransferase
MRKLIRKFLQKFKYDIVKLQPEYISGKLDKASLEIEYKWLKDQGIKSIIDIGANEGQFSEKIRLLFPHATIYAFEPLPDVCKKLVQNFKNDNHFSAFNVGIGETKATLTINCNESTASSSFLSMTDLHKENFTHAVKAKAMEVPIETLDNILNDKIINRPLLIKMDVQGFEDKVIAGGKNILSLADIIITELSFEKLYKEQPLFDDIYKALSDLGFNYCGSIDQLRSPESNKILQADGVFMKK